MIRNKVSRRNFLRGSTVAAAGSSIGLGLMARSGIASPRDDNQSGSIFQHGIASGDPTQDSVVLWTRVTPRARPGQGGQKLTLPVQYVVALDAELDQVVMMNEVDARPANDYCVKVEVTGLQAGQTYYYAFSHGNDSTVEQYGVARTNTLPANPDAARFAIVSCSSYLHGHFNVYRSLATRDWGGSEPLAILHVGDYIYEYGTGEYGTAREAEPDNEIRSLADYRDRHAQYKQDEDLMALHLLYPFITIWDDHETADNAWSGGATQHDESDGLPWEERKNNGRQAYFEWMPIRPGPDWNGDDPDLKYAIYRSFSLGALADLIMLDTRILRTHYEAGNPLPWIGHTAGGEPAAPSWASPDERNEIYNEERRLLGASQENWLYGPDGVSGALTGGNATWRLLGQQIMIGQLKLVGSPNNPVIQEGVAFNTDGWDGWVPSRNQLFEAIGHVNENGGNVVVLTGDIHTSWAMDVCPDPNNPAVYDPFSGRGSVAVEFVCPSVTSPGLPEIASIQDLIRVNNPHIKYVDLERHGYMVLDLDQQEVSCTWWYIDTIDDPSTAEKEGPTFYATVGSRYLQRRGVPVPEASGHEHRFE